MITSFHAKYFAHELTRRHGANGVGRLSQSLFDASADLNPHQIEAALFALKSPLSKGVLLADEVGLGKTIELFNCFAEDAGPANIPDAITQRLAAETQRHTKATISQSLETNRWKLTTNTSMRHVKSLKSGRMTWCWLLKRL